MLPEKPSAPDGQGKKSSKPIMEKRRRARINASLAELKSLLLDAIKKEGTRHSKMEKADILELTVRHLRQLQKQQLSGSVCAESSSLNKYRLGFSDCISEMHRYLSESQDIDADIRLRLLDHVASFNPDPSCAQNQSPECDQMRKSHQTINHNRTSNHVTSIVTAPATCRIPHSNADTKATTTSRMSLLQTPSSTTVLQHSDQHSLGTVSEDIKTLNSVQILPTKLPTGEMAFVLPTNMPLISTNSVPGYIIPVFTAPDMSPRPVLNYSQQPASNYGHLGSFISTQPGAVLQRVDTGQLKVSHCIHSPVPESNSSLNGLNRNSANLETGSPNTEPDSTRTEPEFSERAPSTRHLREASSVNQQQHAMVLPVLEQNNEIESMWRPW